MNLLFSGSSSYPLLIGAPRGLYGRLIGGGIMNFDGLRIVDAVTAGSGD